MKVTPLNQFRELQILWLFPARSSDTGTAGTGIEILGSFSARPLTGPWGNLVNKVYAILSCKAYVGRAFSDVFPKIFAKAVWNFFSKIHQIL